MVIMEWHAVVANDGRWLFVRQAGGTTIMSSPDVNASEDRSQETGVEAGGSSSRGHLEA
jgi:hypothetical protein